MYKNDDLYYNNIDSESFLINRNIRNINEKVKSNFDPGILVLFRRGLRIHDHTALNTALNEISLLDQNVKCSSVMCLFNFDPAQVGDGNEFRSKRCIKYMIESLEDLNNELRNHGSRLFFTYGTSLDSISRVLTEIPTINQIFIHNDVSPYSIEREKLIEELCISKNIILKKFWDDFLVDPGNIDPINLEEFRTFKPFYEYVQTLTVRNVEYINENFKYLVSDQYIYDFEWKDTFSDTEVMKLLKVDKNIRNLYKGGRQTIISKLKDKNYQQNVKTYEETRMIPSVSSTELSAALKFGVISIREAYNFSMSGNYEINPIDSSPNLLSRHLYSREFFYHVALHFPRVLQGKCFNSDWDSQVSSNNPLYWEAWCNGKTGVPFVDAGMRQLLATGYMHNKLRVMTSCFLNKQLDICWKMGEKFFAQHLFDYDASLNNAGWQSSCGFGASPQNWSGVMNPWGQAQKFDKECIYIKRWIPELREVDNQVILNWDKQYVNYKDINYPMPIVDHIVEKNRYIIKINKLLNKKLTDN